MELEETESSVVQISMRKFADFTRRQNVGRTSKDVIHDWYLRFATNCGQRPSEAQELLWIDELSDIDPLRLEYAFRAVIRIHVFATIPQIGQIRAQLDGAAQSAAETAAEVKWGKVLEYIRLHFNPDIPPCPACFNRKRCNRHDPPRVYPRIGKRTQHAIDAAGGLTFLADCDRQDLPWARKRFIEAYLRYGELEQSQFLLPDGELKESIAALAERKELPPAHTSVEAADETLPRVPMSDCERKLHNAEIVRLRTQIGPARQRYSLAQLQEDLSKLGELETDPDRVAGWQRQKAEFVARGLLPT
jgi:hypothetical protein